MLFSLYSFSCTTSTTTVSTQLKQLTIRVVSTTLERYYSLYGFNIWMSRQRQPFCMGQCLSCGSTIPNTPEFENNPAFITASSASFRSVSKANDSSVAGKEQSPLVLTLSSDLRPHQSQLHQPSKSAAAKFVTVFSQKKIVTRRINPEGGESPIHIPSETSPSILPLKITTLLTSPVLQDGGINIDMKGASPAKNYFRETISSAKKSSKTVTFSEATSSPSPLVPAPTSSTTATRKTRFFSFSKSNKEKDSVKKSEEDSKSTSRGFLRKKTKTRSPSPATATSSASRSRSPNDRQIARITLSPNKASSRSKKSPDQARSAGSSEGLVNKIRNGENSEETGTERNDPRPNTLPTTNDNQTMGNASSSQGNAVEVVNKFKPVVKSNSTNIIKGALNNKRGDINENTTPAHQSFPSSKSVESPGLIHKNYNDGRHQHATTKKSESDVIIRDLNSIREENRLLRLKFFLEDSSDHESRLSCSPPSEDPSLTLINSVERENMNRHNFTAGNKSSIPLPKSSTTTVAVAGNKAVSSTTGIPKLYSVPTLGLDSGDARQNHQHPAQKATSGSRLKYHSKAVESSLSQQPTNLNSGNWVPAADFFPPAHNDNLQRPHSSPSTARSNRRLSEPHRPNHGSKSVREGRGADGNVDRRGTVGFQPGRKLTGTQHGGIPKATKTVAALSERTAVKSTVATTTTKIGVRKPEETKPFYTMGLYQNRPKPVEPPSKTFGVLQSGFQGVSTGIVKQRAQQYQSKVAEVSSSSSTVATAVSSVVSVKDKEAAVHQQTVPKKKESHTPEESPIKPGVQRSATYTIRKHGDSAANVVDERGDHGILRAVSDADPRRYLTWTKRSHRRGKEVLKSSRVEETTEDSVMNQSTGSDASGISTSSFHQNQMGYPLQQSASAASTSSMGTNEDGGDHVIISDSEYLIDDEISDQPDLTLTFKDSSLNLSPSSSGESLLSGDIMLDHLDHNQDRILGELTSDSAISDISTHKPQSQKSSDHFSKLTDIKSSIIDQCSKAERRGSPIETSPSTVRTVRHPKSPRRIATKTSTTPFSSNSRPVRQAATETGGSTGIPKFTSSHKSPVSTTTVTTRNQNQRTTPETKASSGKPSHVRSILTGSTSLSPVNQSRVARKENVVVGLTIENVNKLHKEYQQLGNSAEFINSSSSSPAVIEHENSSLPVPLVDELITEFHGMKDELEKLRAQLESQERREREKDELIQRLTGEVERLKSFLDEESPNKLEQRSRNGSIISPKGNEPFIDTSAHKERYLNSLNYENAAVQTDNNNMFNRAVTYPEEADKYGELVSFRIGRSSSVKNKKL